MTWGWLLLGVGAGFISGFATGLNYSMRTYKHSKEDN